MHVVFMVPGIMGTELFLPSPAGGDAEKVWPPTPLETQFGYKRREKLADPRVTVGEIIPNVLCFEFYRPLAKLLAGLGFRTYSSTKRLMPFPYDWRLDLFTTAAKLSTALDAAHAAGATRISLVAHSMGGLVSRLVLEDSAYRSRPWFANIDQLIAIATPHLGAPLALARALGQDDAMGISGEDFAWLSSQLAYPSAYQLLPAPGESACWNQSDAGLQPLDIHDPAVAALLGLVPALLARAQALHEVLGKGNAPKSVRYFYFAAAGHRTVTRINLFKGSAGGVDWSKTALTRTEDGGDGTVPIYSALPRLGQRHIASNDHAGAFTGDAFKKVFVRLLGGNAGSALETVFDVQTVDPVLELSVEAPVVPAGKDIEVLLHNGSAGEHASVGVDAMLSEVVGELVLTRRANDNSETASVERRIPLAYSGPPLSRITVYLAPIEEPGLYTLVFEGQPSTQSKAAFSVCAPQQRRTD